MPRAFDEMQPIAHDWDRLAAQSDFPNVFLTWGFNRAWWRAFGADLILRTIVVTDDGGRTRLIAPFCAQAGKSRDWGFIANFSGEYNDIIVADGDDEAVDHLFRWLGRNGDWCELSLGRVAGNSLGTHFRRANGPEVSLGGKLRGWLALGTPLVYRTANREHPYADREALSKMRGLVATKHYAQHVNWFRRNGDFAYEVVTSPDEIRALLPRFMEMHAREWRKKTGRAQFDWDLARRFFEYMTEDMADAGSLRLDVLRFNGAVVAAHFGFFDRQRLYFYKPCFDLDYAQHSPGKVLLAYMIQWAADNGLQEFDFLRGLDSYKERYTSHIRATWGFHVQRSRLRALGEKLSPKSRTVPLLQDA